MFLNHLISLCGDITWPARLPDLNPCDFFFLWGYLKSKVFSHHPRSLEELKRSIRSEIDALPPKMIHWVMENFHERLKLCVSNDGKHLTDLIFKTEIKWHSTYIQNIKSIFFIFSLTKWFLDTLHIHIYIYIHMAVFVKNCSSHLTVSSCCAKC